MQTTLKSIDPRPLIISLFEVKPYYSRYQLTEAEIQLEGHDLHIHTTNLNTNYGRGVVIYTHRLLLKVSVPGHCKTATCTNMSRSTRE